MNQMSDVVGYMATISTCATLLPQIHKVIVSKSASDLSYSMIALNLTSDVLWTVYGTLNGKTPLIVTGVITASTAITLAALKCVLTARAVSEAAVSEAAVSEAAVSEAAV